MFVCKNMYTAERSGFFSIFSTTTIVDHCRDNHSNGYSSTFSKSL